MSRERRDGTGQPGGKPADDPRTQAPGGRQTGSEQGQQSGGSARTFTREQVDRILDRQLTAEISQRTITGLLTRLRSPGGMAEAAETFIEEASHLAVTVCPDVIVCAPPALLFDALETAPESENEADVARETADEGDAAVDTAARPSFTIC